MNADLKRCVRCHQRYPEPLGHRCPLTSLSHRREEEFAHALSEMARIRRPTVRRVPGAEAADWRHVKDPASSHAWKLVRV